MVRSREPGGLLALPGWHCLPLAAAGIPALALALAALALAAAALAAAAFGPPSLGSLREDG